MAEVTIRAIGPKAFFNFRGLKANGTQEFAPLSGTDSKNRRYNLLHGIPASESEEDYIENLYRSLRIYILDFTGDDGAVISVGASFELVDNVPNLAVELSKVGEGDVGRMTVIVERIHSADL